MSKSREIAALNREIEALHAKRAHPDKIAPLLKRLYELERAR